MISTVPEIWNKKYRPEPLIIGAEHTFLNYSHTLRADSKKTWIDSSGLPYLVFGFSMRKRLILDSMSSVLLMVCLLQKGSRFELYRCLWFMVVLYSLLQPWWKCIRVWGLVDVDFFSSNSSLICVHFKCLVHLGISTFVTNHLLLCFHLWSQLIISFRTIS